MDPPPLPEDDWEQIEYIYINSIKNGTSQNFLGALDGKHIMMRARPKFKFIVQQL